MMNVPFNSYRKCSASHSTHFPIFVLIKLSCRENYPLTATAFRGESNSQKYDLRLDVPRRQLERNKLDVGISENACVHVPGYPEEKLNMASGNEFHVWRSLEFMPPRPRHFELVPSQKTVTQSWINVLILNYLPDETKQNPQNRHRQRRYPKQFKNQMSLFMFTLEFYSNWRSQLAIYIIIYIYYIILCYMCI